MADTKTTLTWLLRDQVSATARKVNGELDKLGLKAKTGGGAMGRLGAATGGLISPMALLAGAAFGAGAALGSMIEGAIEDEKVQARLVASLRANVKGWDGSTEAIDRYVAAQVSMGFHDEEIAASLAQLIGATGDVAVAQQFQATAMDLARFKGISLADATDALTRVEGGSYRILKSLGIEIPKNTDKMTALGLVHNQVKGQADAFGKTTEGAFAKVNSKLDQATDKIGKNLLPAVTAFANYVADTLIPGIEDAATQFGKWIDQINGMLKPLDELAKKLDAVLPKVAPITGQESFLKQIGFPGHAAGGWVGLHGPEIVLAGERGPEYIVPNHALGGGGVGAHTHPIYIGTPGLWRALSPYAGAELVGAAITSVRP